MGAPALHVPEHSPETDTRETIRRRLGQLEDSLRAASASGQPVPPGALQSAMDILASVHSVEGFQAAMDLLNPPFFGLHQTGHVAAQLTQLCLLHRSDDPAILYAALCCMFDGTRAQQQAVLNVLAAQFDIFRCPPCKRRLRRSRSAWATWPKAWDPKPKR